MQHHRFPHLFRLLFLWLFVAALPVLVRAQAPDALNIGVLDEDKLAEGYTKYRDAAVALENQAKSLDSQLDARELLNEAEGRRFDELVVKETRTPAEETEFQNIIKAGSGRRAEIAGLIGKATKSDAENARVKALNDQAEINRAPVKTLEDSLFNMMKKRQQKLEDDYIERANNVIQQVAADKKLALVWRKRAVIWNAASVDITSEVLSRLNK